MFDSFSLKVGDDTRDELPMPEPAQRIDKPSDATKESEGTICAAPAATDIVTNSSEAAEAKPVPADCGETLSSDSEDDSHGKLPSSVFCSTNVRFRSNLTTSLSSRRSGRRHRECESCARSIRQGSTQKNKWKCSLKGGIMTLMAKTHSSGRRTGNFSGTDVVGCHLC